MAHHMPRLTQRTYSDVLNIAAWRTHLTLSDSRSRMALHQHESEDCDEGELLVEEHNLTGATLRYCDVSCMTILTYRVACRPVYLPRAG